MGVRGSPAAHLPAAGTSEEARQCLEAPWLANKASSRCPGGSGAAVSVSPLPGPRAVALVVHVFTARETTLLSNCQVEVKSFSYLWNPAVEAGNSA